MNIMGIQRDSNIELFRVILMLLIIAHHFSLHYVIKDGLPLSSFERLYILLIGAWGKVAVDCFVIITGYFMCLSRITIRKFLKLFIEIGFYKIVIYLLLLYWGRETFGYRRLFFLPIEDDFAGNFLLLYLTIPFLNKLVKSINEREHLFLVGLLLFVFSFWWQYVYSDRISYYVWFCALYCIASSVRIYNLDKCLSTVKWGRLSENIM